MYAMDFPKLPSDTMLAPMDGVNDVAFRILCRRYGAGIAFTEMVSATALVRRNKSAMRKSFISNEEQPVRAVQIFGQNTKEMVAAARLLEDKCDIIDINFGCPMENIMSQGAGSALLKKPHKIKEIVSAVSKAVSIPVTCKLRLGIDASSINIIYTSKLCEEAGASMVTVHARTQNQMYSGKAEWGWIKKVKEELSIPVTGNGDVRSPEDYMRMKRETGCDYVMIGRAALGDPYIFTQINDYRKSGTYKKRDRRQQVDDFLAYFELAEKYRINMNFVRFHAQRFTAGMKNSNKMRDELARLRTLDEIKQFMKKL